MSNEHDAIVGMERGMPSCSESTCSYFPDIAITCGVDSEDPGLLTWTLGAGINDQV